MYLASRMNVQSEINCKRKAILNSAMELIRDHGFHGAPMSLIAKHAGVASGTIYHYFSGKEEVIKEIFREVNKELGSTVFVARDPGLSFRDQFFIEARRLYKYYLEQPSVLHFLELYKNSPYFKETISETNQFVCNFWEFCRVGIEEGAVKPMMVEFITPVLFGTVSSMAKVHCAGRFCYSEDNFDEVIKIVWEGIRTRPEST